MMANQLCRVEVLKVTGTVAVMRGHRRTEDCFQDNHLLTYEEKYAVLPWLSGIWVSPGHRRGDIETYRRCRWSLSWRNPTQISTIKSFHTSLSPGLPPGNNGRSFLTILTSFKKTCYFRLTTSLYKTKNQVKIRYPLGYLDTEWIFFLHVWLNKRRPVYREHWPGNYQ